jgi:hypothetical protein
MFFESDNELFDLVKKELCVGWQFNAVTAATRQARIAQANARLEAAHIEGLGQHVASIDQFAYHDWERREPGITRDPDWLKSLLRDNPECRVQSSSSKTQVSFAGLSAPGTDQETKRLRDEEPPVGSAGPADRLPSTRHSSHVTRHSSDSLS